VSTSCKKKAKLLGNIFGGSAAAGEPSAPASALPDSSGGVPPLGVVGMAGLVMVAVSLVILLRLLRTS
jgi:hypothetical protein